MTVTVRVTVKVWGRCGEEEIPCARMGAVATHVVDAEPFGKLYGSVGRKADVRIVGALRTGGNELETREGGLNVRIRVGGRVGGGIRGRVRGLVDPFPGPFGGGGPVQDQDEDEHQLSSFKIGLDRHQESRQWTWPALSWASKIMTMPR